MGTRIACAVTMTLVGWALMAAGPGQAQERPFKPVTNAMLDNPDPADWLMMNRTHDEQRFSPLDQINTRNVGKLTLAWSRGLPGGAPQESTPIVHDGVMYLLTPGGFVQALNAVDGEMIWEYAPDYPRRSGSSSWHGKSLAIYQDMVYFAAPGGELTALDAITGKVRWKAKVDTGGGGPGGAGAGGVVVADGKVISNRSCEPTLTRADCFIAAHDAITGKEVWKFYTAAGVNEPGGETWSPEIPDEKRLASPWGLPGSYDPVRKVLYWGVANPMPYTLLKRYGTTDRPKVTPSDLYSNSTVALDVETGKLRWYYQELPSDDWDLDHNQERILVRTKISPDPKHVKWISAALKPGQVKDVVVTVAEGGSLFVVERESGQFLWAMPFPYDRPDVHIKGVDPVTGKVMVNSDLNFLKDGDKRLVCFHNTRSWWSTAYSPQTNSLYVPFHNACLQMTADQTGTQGHRDRYAVITPGWDAKKYMQLAKVDMTTGKMEILFSQPQPSNGAALTTAGGLLFNGDLNRHLRAFDARSGKILWDQRLGGMVISSTITYAVDGRQYVMVFTGEGMSGTTAPLKLAEANMPTPVRGHHAVYVFALPQDAR